MQHISIYNSESNGVTSDDRTTYKEIILRKASINKVQIRDHLPHLKLNNPINAPPTETSMLRLAIEIALSHPLMVKQSLSYQGTVPQKMV